MVEKKFRIIIIIIIITVAAEEIPSLAAEVILPWQPKRKDLPLT